MPMTESQLWLAHHSAHDFDEILRRWRELIEPCCLSETTLSDQNGYPVVAYRTQTAPDAENGIYLCAGVHGDEPAGVWGLLEWAEENREFLRDSAAMIFPCFNPAGLINNTRLDGDGRDLNRLFQDQELPLMKTWHEFIDGLQFRISLLLHEDYDARGIYTYELTQKDVFLGDPILAECEALIPREPRSQVDEMEFENGIMRRTGEIIREVEKRLDGGYPEAIYLYLHHSRYSLTFETPSEFSLWERVQAQRQFIDSAIRISGDLPPG